MIISILADLFFIDSYFVDLVFFLQRLPEVCML